MMTQFFLILSSDNAIQNKTKFTASIQESELAEENKLVISGITGQHIPLQVILLSCIDQKGYI